MNDQQPSRRLDAYIRVSSVAGREGERFISPKEQEERIRAWATANGHEVIAVHRELNVSGGTMDRPKLNEVMRRIDAGETDGVVVLKLDRFGRTLVGSLQLIERIHERGALFASVSDGFDITTETGRLVLRILLSLAQFELERIRAQWRSSRARALERGWHLGETPFGYTRAVEVDEKTGRRRPTGPLLRDPETGPVVTEVFRRRAAGATWRSIRDWLDESGVRTKGGKRWTTSSLMSLVNRKTYLGIASGGHAGDAPVKDAHEPLVDEATWHAAQERRTMRADGAESPTIARGVVRCAGCRYSMSLHKVSNRGYVVWQYKCARHANEQDCPAPAGVVALIANGKLGLDDYVVEKMWERLRGHEVKFEAADTGVVELRLELEEAESRLTAAAMDTELEDVLGRAAWLKRLGALRADSDVKRDRLEQALRETGRLGRPVVELRQEWETTMSMDEKREQLARVVRYVFVRPRTGEVAPPSRSTNEELRRDYFDDRVHIVWTSDPEVEVPRQGARGYRIRPFVFPDANPDDAGVAAA
jgi:DNA invertase Pin-like site-specific DNA recombinase